MFAKPMKNAPHYFFEVFNSTEAGFKTLTTLAVSPLIAVGRAAAQHLQLKCYLVLNEQELQLSVSAIGVLAAFRFKIFCPGAHQIGLWFGLCKSACALA